MKYPWQEKQWKQVWSAYQAGRLPHGLLLTGMAGIGKLHFAEHLAQALLCQKMAASDEPCGLCHACRLALTAAHPNIHLVTPEKEGHAIKVDQIRDLAEFVQQSSMQQGLRIVIINPAHSMNVNAANALLKTLEEPAEGAIIILVTDQAGSILPTIKSRCQRILFPRPEQEIALKWLSQADSASSSDDIRDEQALRLAHGAPLAALAIKKDDILPLRTELFRALSDLANKKADPLALAAKWQKSDPVQWLDLLAGWTADLLRLQLGADAAQLHNQDFAAELTTTAANIPIKRNQHVMQRAVKMRGQLSAGLNYNKQLLMESLLIHWAGQA